jgi:hypothetical protein
MSFISQHTAAEIERAISSVIADTSGDNAATAQTSLTNTWTIPLWTGNAGFVTVANLTSHVASGLTASDIGLGNVENTALSTWAGSTNLTTLGTITTGTWNGDTIASAYIGSHTHAASDVISGAFADARIAETNVTQHEAALSITESQISDFGTYANAVHTHDAGDIASGTFADARIAQSSVTQHQAALSITESQISDFGSYATTTALSSHTGDTSNPHSVTASQLSDFAEAVDDRVAILVQDGTGITWTYADASNTLTGNVSLASFTTSDLSEGTNLYYTDARARAAISASGDLSYNSGTGVISFSETYGTASELLTALLTVDGAGSSLDADLLDGQEGTYYLAWANLTGVPSTFAPSAHTHASSEITDFQEAVEDVTGNLITAGTNISVSYNDVSGVLTISSTASTDSLDDIGDVTISSATTGDLVRWNGVAWVNYADSNYAASSHTHAASDVTSGTLADARISESSVTQHESALSIASSQISDKASANGVASLDGTGKIPSSQLPAIALSEVFVVASQSAQLALTAQEGDVVVRTDQSTTYIHNGGTAGTMADYTELQTPSAAPVTSVNGYTGAVSLTTSDISEGTNLYYTSARFDTAFSGKDTDDLTEGATNQYFTNARSRSAISLTSTNTSELSYDSNTGVFSYVSPTTVTGANSVTLEVRNTTGATIPKGAAVYISGHSGSKILIDLADSDASGKYPAIGLAAGAIANNSDGEVTVYGELAGVNTSSYNVGDVLYLSSTAGALTNTRPTSNADAVQNIGKVARSDSNGIIIVSGSGRANDIPNLTNTHVFIGGASGNEQRALAAGDILSGTFADARISESSVTQHVAAIDHDSLLNFVANEHIDWTNASSNFATTGTFSAGQSDFNSGTGNRVATFTSTDSIAYVSFMDSNTTVNSYVFVGAVGDTLRLRGGNTDIDWDGTTFDLNGAAFSSGAATVSGNTTINPTSANSLNVHQTNDERVELTLRTDATTNLKQIAKINFVTLDRSWWWGMSTDGTVRLFDTTAGTDTIIVRGGAGNYSMTIGSSGTGYGVETASARLHAVSTTEQLRLGYDVTNRASFTVNSSGNLTIAPTGGNTSITGTLDVTGVGRFGTSVLTADATYDNVVIESAANTGLSIITNSTTGDAGIMLGAQSNTTGAMFRYNESGGNAVLATRIAGHDLILRSGNNTTALTLDSTQNATFAGNVYGKSSTVNTSWAFDVATDGGIAVGAGYTDGRLYAEGSQSASLVLHDSGGTANLRTIALQINGDSAKLYGYNDSGTLRHSWIEMNQSTGDMTLGAGDLTLSSGDLFVESGALLVGTTSASGSELFKVDGDAIITGTMEATIDGGSY